MDLRSIFAIFLIALLAVSPVYALDKGTADIEDAGSYSYESKDGYVVYQVVIDSLPFGTNQSHVYYYDGAEWHIDIETWTDSIQHHNAIVTVTYPNGTPISKSVSTWSIWGSYQTAIQPVDLYSSGNFIEVNLEVGIDPVATTMSSSFPMDWSAQDAIAFDEVSGSFTGDATSDIFVSWMSEADFKKSVNNYDPGAWWASYAGDIFQWSWEMVQAIIGAIPVVGPLFLDVFDIMGVVLTQGFFWLLWIVNNFPAILLSVEGLICLFAVINTPAKGRGGLYRLIRNLYMYNVLFITGVAGIIMWTATGVKMIIETILGAIQALKPI